MSLIKKHINLLKCPNSNLSLKIVDNFLYTENNKHKYRILDSNFIELLPKKPYQMKPNSKWLKDNNFYVNQLSKYIKLNDNIEGAWGVFENMSIGHKNFISYQKDVLNKIILGKRKKIAIDIAGGVGTHSLELSKYYDLVIHLDLWDRSINYAYNKAKKLGIDNVLFIRGDYFNLPINDNIADLIISVDSFDYYSVEDDVKVLQDCERILNNNGLIFCDLHNKKGIFDNLQIHEYTKEEISTLSSNFRNIEIRKFCRIPSRFLYFRFFQYIEKLFFFIPFVRWILIIKK